MNAAFSSMLVMVSLRLRTSLKVSEPYPPCSTTSKLLHCDRVQSCNPLDNTLTVMLMLLLCQTFSCLEHCASRIRRRTLLVLCVAFLQPTWTRAPVSTCGLGLGVK